MALAVGCEEIGTGGRPAGGPESVMAGLVPAIHVVRRSEGSQTSEKGEKLCVCLLLLLGPLTSDSSLKRRGVDGWDKPGHDPSADQFRIPNSLQPGASQTNPSGK